MSATKQDSLPLTDSTAIVFNSGDSTKKVRISAASVATGTTRVLTAQDLDGIIALLSQPATFTTVLATGGVTPNFTSAETAITVAAATNFAHGLGVVPRLFLVTLRNKTAELGYSIGDETTGTSSCADATNVTSIAAAAINIIRKDTFVGANITPGNWRYVAKAWV